MVVPSFQAVMLPLLHLASDTEPHLVRDAVDHMAKHFDLTAEERRELMPDGRRTRLHYNIEWARTYLKKAGLLDYPQRGTFRDYH